MRRCIVLVGAVVVGLASAGCAGRAVDGALPRAVPTVAATAASDSVTIGALPERQSVLIHGRAPLASLDPAMRQDLTTFADGQGNDPEEVLQDYAAQPAFDDAVAIATSADAGFADAVFAPGVDAASDLRFTRRPPQALLDRLEQRYPRDLLVSWGEHLAGEDDRVGLSGLVVGIVGAVPGAEHPSAGFDGDGRLVVAFDGDASPRAAADAILAAPAFRATFVGGAPPTEVRVTRVAENAVIDW